jgi:ATP-dependent protease ClpP protease subunit
MRLNNRSLFKPRVKGSYKISNKAEEATIYLYDEISWFGISAEQFVKDLADIKAGVIHLRVNSPGGSVFDGTAIYNAIKAHKAKVIAHVDGLAASIASIIVMAADEIRMGENAFMMIHEPWSLVVGGADDMRKEADLLDKVAGTIINTYVSRSGKTEDEIKGMMSEETWLTAQEALDGGFCDFIDKEKAEKAQTMFDLSAFAHTPEVLQGKQQPTARDLERILRDAGCSNKQAKAILAEGFKEGHRDDEITDPPPAPVAQREVEAPKKKDRVSDLLTRAEVAAPSL